MKEERICEVVQLEEKTFWIGFCESCQNKVTEIFYIIISQLCFYYPAIHVLLQYILVHVYFADDVLFSRRGRMGRIVSPRHTLPPNTTCTYHFHGYPGDLIWLSFTSYNLQILQQTIQDNNTLGRVGLNIFL